MMFSRAASLRHLATPPAASLFRPAAAAPVLRSSPLSTTAKRAPKKAAVPAPEASAAAAPQQAARDRPLPPHFEPAEVKPPTEIPFQPKTAKRAPKTAKRAPKKAAVLAPEAAAATAPQQAARDRPLPPHFDPAEVKRPTEIPFQPQIANTVHLVGTVGVLPVLEEKSPGEYQAVSVIVEKKDAVENDSLQLWIPVIFQGDLAQIAAWHLKENDLVYIVGHLSGGEATTKVEDAHSKIRIFARSLNFVESNSGKDDKLASEQDKKMASDHLEDPWKDVIENPTKWWDNRLNKPEPTSADFKHKDSGVALWLSDSPPSWVLEKLPPAENSEDLWKDVIENPTKWWDSRLNKRNPRAPDFRHKDSGVGLCLSGWPRPPSWVLEKLPPAENPEDLWKDVIENPTKWWDVRLNKRNPRAPDFRHKDSGVGLCLSGWPRPPSWVLEKLPPAENPEDLWKDVIENPTKWWDGRLNKRNPRAPDFRHKDSGVGLWLSNSPPSWVLEKLPPTESPTNSDRWAKAAILS